MKRARVIAALSALVVLAACESSPYGGGNYGIGGMGTKQTVGTLAGAGVGALIGSQIGGGSGKLAAVAVGTLAGAFLGSELGKSLDRADQQYAAQAQYNAVQYGEPYSWQNPQSGNYGTVQPSAAYASPYGQQCREYTHTVYIGGRQERAYGTACRQPDGSWRITNS
jgi:surface antigen